MRVIQLSTVIKAVVVFFCLGTFCSCNHATTLSPREAARQCLKQEIAYIAPDTDPTPVESKLRFERALKLLNKAGEDAISPTPIDVVFQQWERSTLKLPSRSVAIKWLETGNDVIGFFIQINGEIREYNVFDPQSKESQQQAKSTEYRLNVAFITSPGGKAADYDSKYIKSEKELAQLPLDFLQHIFSQEAGSNGSPRTTVLPNVNVGLLLKDGKKSPVCTARVCFRSPEKKKGREFETGTQLSSGDTKFRGQGVRVEE